jgi:hypothetical protein
LRAGLPLPFAGARFFEREGDRTAFFAPIRGAGAVARLVFFVALKELPTRFELAARFGFDDDLDLMALGITHSPVFFSRAQDGIRRISLARDRFARRAPRLAWTPWT